MRLLGFSTVKQGKKNWNFTNSTQIPLTIFHHLGGKFKIWNWEEKGLKMLLKWQIEETFFFVFFGDKVRARHRTDGKNKGLSVCLDLGRLGAQPSILAVSFRIYLVSFTSQFSQEITKWTKILHSSIHNKSMSIWEYLSFIAKSNIILSSSGGNLKWRHLPDKSPLPVQITKAIRPFRWD